MYRMQGFIARHAHPPFQFLKKLREVHSNVIYDVIEGEDAGGQVVLRINTSTPYPTKKNHPHKHSHRCEPLTLETTYDDFQS